jgi:hypothetical protein
MLTGLPEGSTKPKKSMRCARGVAAIKSNGESSVLVRDSDDLEVELAVHVWLTLEMVSLRESGQIKGDLPPVTVSLMFERIQVLGVLGAVGAGPEGADSERSLPVGVSPGWRNYAISEPAEPLRKCAKTRIPFENLVVLWWLKEGPGLVATLSHCK